MLWGAAAAGIPIALHFFFRSRYRTVPWAAMKFLLTSVEQTSRRLKFQEYALLLLRMMVLTLLAVAFMRPLNLTLWSCLWIGAAALLFCITLSWWVLTWNSNSLLRSAIQFVGSYFFILILWIVLAVAFPFMTANPSAVARGPGESVHAVMVFDQQWPSHDALPVSSSRPSETRAGTHNHRLLLLRRGDCQFALQNRRGVWVPAFAGTTAC